MITVSRTLAHPEGAIHVAADAHVERLGVAVKYAFARARKALRTSAHGQVPDALQVAAALGVLRASLADLLAPTLKELLLAGGQVGVRSLGALKAAGGRDSALRVAKKTREIGPFAMAFDVNSPEAIAWAEEHAAELIDGISETSRGAINTAIAKALEYGDLGEMFERILDAVGDDTRADLIARTEVMTAANEGLRQSWSQAEEKGLLTGNEKRVWIATGDATVCPTCEDLDGEVADLHGLYPDPGGNGPPQHPRCRCTEGLTS